MDVNVFLSNVFRFFLIHFWILFYFTCIFLCEAPSACHFSDVKYFELHFLSERCYINQGLLTYLLTNWIYFSLVLPLLQIYNVGT